jgi:site-specific DNA recombinase
MKTKIPTPAKALFSPLSDSLPGTPSAGRGDAPKRMALYARVSSDEQTRGNYPSCESQVEELVGACKARNWQIAHIIKDEGFSAGSLKRPGLSELRWLIEAGEIDGLLCTWYDRLTRSRDFYVLDKEFQAHGVEFITLHDPTDTTTAAGRFMECMLVAAKTYEREQTAEKVRSKMRMRAEKGMWNGGPVPYGFRAVSKDRTIKPDPECSGIVAEMFKVYLETQSDSKVRDWLKAHQIPTSKGNTEWRVSAIRKILINRRYIAEIEINRENKGIAGLPESEAYRIVRASYKPFISREVFERAQAIRKEKALGSPNRKGRPRSFSQTQCQRVYPLQGLLICGHCSHAMAPWYVRHRAGEHGGKKRKTDSFINYYLCAGQQKNWKGCDHKNMVLARVPEAWILDRVTELVESEDMIERAMESARNRSVEGLQPARETLLLTQQALNKNQEQINALVESISSGNAQGALWNLLNEKATRLNAEREGLLMEQRRLSEALSSLDENFDAGVVRGILGSFSSMAKGATPEELQRLMRLAVRQIEWMPDGEHRVHFRHFAKPPHLSGEKAGREWFHTMVHNGSPSHRSCEPLILQVWRDFNGVLVHMTSVFSLV